MVILHYKLLQVEVILHVWKIYFPPLVFMRTLMPVWYVRVYIYNVTMYTLYMLTKLLCPLQGASDTALQLATKGGHIACVKHLLSTPGIDVNLKGRVSQPY